MVIQLIEVRSHRVLHAGILNVNGIFQESSLGIGRLWTVDTIAEIFLLLR